MQTLAAEIAITFVEDAIALVRGSVRIVMAPIERLANTCDVAGVLPARRSSGHLKRVQTRRTASNAGTTGVCRRRPLHRRVFSFRSLSDLT
jgi:hypothetical protein